MNTLAVAAVAMGAQIADLVTSLYGFTRGAVETNPLIHTAAGLLGAKAVACALIAYALAISGALGNDHPRVRSWVHAAIIFSAGATAYVAVGNLRVIL